MSTEIAKLSDVKINLPATALEAMSEFDEIAKGSDWLPRIQLVTKGQYVDTGRIPPGRWGIPSVGGDIFNLGETIDVIPLVFRSKAMDVSNRDAIIVSFDRKSDEFKRIMTAPKNTSCLWGPAFLIWERSTEKFYELFMNNKSGRVEAEKFKPFLLASTGGQMAAATLSIRYRTKGANGWHVPVISRCSLPFDVLPDAEAVNYQIEKFMSQTSGIERASEEEAATQGRAR